MTLQRNARRLAVALALVATALGGVACTQDEEPEDVAVVDVDDDDPDRERGAERGTDEEVKPVWIDSEGNVKDGPTLPDMPEKFVPPPVEPEDPDIALPEDPDALYELVASRVSEALTLPRAPEALQAGAALGAAERGRLVKEWNEAKDSWRDAAWVVSKAGAAYRDATSAEERDNRVLGWAGLARAELSTLQTSSDADVSRRVAVDLLREYVEHAEEGADLLPASLGRLGVMLLQLGTEARMAEGADHLERAAELHLARGERAEAGSTLFYLLSTLVQLGEEARGEQIVDRLGVAGGDFGPSTDSMARLSKRVAIYPGATLPELPVVPAVGGGEIDLSALRGRHVLLHYFQAGLPTGSAAEWNEIETVLAPLHRKYGDSLQLVGVSMDFEMPDAMYTQRVADWDEWGKKGTPHDGKVETVRGIVEEQGLDWPWHWDGKWMKNALTQAVGLPANAPFAILVDPTGRVVYRGAPDEALTEAVESAIAAE